MHLISAPPCRAAPPSEVDQHCSVLRTRPGQQKVVSWFSCSASVVGKPLASHGEGEGVSLSSSVCPECCLGLNMAVICVRTNEQRFFHRKELRHYKGVDICLGFILNAQVIAILRNSPQLRRTPPYRKHGRGKRKRFSAVYRIEQVNQGRERLQLVM